ncbi:MAG TPA: hypothetical protein VLJ15_04135 [Gammaproteobacteria bacterium]|nr:hypothetical protein [Gammaproteobacteria bacterium]
MARGRSFSSRDIIMGSLALAETAAGAASNFYFGYEMSNQVMNWLGTPAPDSVAEDARLYVGGALALLAVGAGYARCEVTKYLNPSRHAVVPEAEVVLLDEADKPQVPQPLTKRQQAAVVFNTLTRTTMVSNVLSVATDLVTDKIAGAVLPTWAAPVSKSVFTAVGLFSGIADSKSAAGAMAVNNMRTPAKNVYDPTPKLVPDYKSTNSDRGGDVSEKSGCCPVFRRK